MGNSHGQLPLGIRGTGPPVVGPPAFISAPSLDEGCGPGGVDGGEELGPGAPGVGFGPSDGELSAGGIGRSCAATVGVCPHSAHAAIAPTAEP